MRCYRIKHIPSGWYWKPSRDALVTWQDGTDHTCRIWVKSNLSKEGKIYPRNPGFHWVSGGFYNHLEVRRILRENKADYTTAYRTRQCFPFVESEWLIEEVTES